MEIVAGVTQADPAAAARRVKEHALALGFDAVGIAGGGPERIRRAGGRDHRRAGALHPLPGGLGCTGGNACLGVYLTRAS
jgi:hypothetical protein